MIALDTNVVVRLLVDDDPAQTRRARRLVESRRALIVPSVLLETEWVLRGAYRIERAAIVAHVSFAEEAEQFATFDTRLAKRATAITGRRVSAL